MKKIILCLLLIYGLSLIPGSLALAADSGTTDTAGASIGSGVSNFGNLVYGSSKPKDLRETVLSIIQGALAVLGTLFVVLLIYGGFLYMTSSGKEDHIKKAKNLILYAVIGLVIIVISYSVTFFIFRSLIESAGPGYQGVNP